MALGWVNGDKSNDQIINQTLQIAAQKINQKLTCNFTSMDSILWEQTHWK